MTETKKGAIAWLAMAATVAAFAVFQPTAKVQAGTVCISRSRPIADTAPTITPPAALRSDADLVRRLRNIQGAESATVDYWSAKLMEGTAESINRSRAEDMAIIDSIGAHQAKLDLATRDLNRFMR